MSAGICGSWYDLAEGDRAAYLEWAHTVYLPALQALDGVRWVAHYRYQGGGDQMARIRSEVVSHAAEEVGQGTQFLVLVGAASPHVFFQAEVEAVMQAPEHANWLAMRQGERTVVFVEEADVPGPGGAGALPDAPAPAIQMGTLRPRSLEAEWDLMRWYAQYRLPAMSRMTGCVRTRKLSGVAGWAKHGILYEFESLAQRLQHFEQQHESLALSERHWTHRITRGTWHAPGSPFVGERIWPEC